MSQNKFIFLLFGLMICSFGFAEDDPQSYAGKVEMSGYQLDDYKNFEKKWKVVTVRYRKDTGEMRFTYANDKAWKALKAGGKNYPEGSVFAKIGLKTEEDPAFVSSAVPSGARRYQLMVKNSKKHAETNGWGYALFDQNGLTFPGNTKAAVQACAACHNLVPDRNYIFSQEMILAPYVKAKSTTQNILDSRITFETVSFDQLPEALKLQIPPNQNQIQKLTGVLSVTLFSGTLDEIRPTLYKEARRSQRPTVLFDKEANSFSLVYILSEKTKCSIDQIALMSIIKSPDKKAVSQIICLPKAD